MASSEIPSWYRSVVGEQIQRLVALGLAGSPGYDTIKLTAQAWAESLWSAPVQWDESLDTPRLRTAFQAVARNAERWPAPRHVLDALPSRPQPRKLPLPEPTPEQIERNRRWLDEELKRAGLRPSRDR